VSVIVVNAEAAKLMRHREVFLPPEFNDRYGRLRSARSGPDGALYVTTSDGGNDKLLLRAPA
jgi:glucose/arabinose dehydrogenase